MSIRVLESGLVSQRVISEEIVGVPLVDGTLRAAA
jgi:hypothetical protein